MCRSERDLKYYLSIFLCLNLFSCNNKINKREELSIQFPQRTQNLIHSQIISIYTVDYKPIDKNKVNKILPEFDTIISCLWTRPRVLDNKYYKGFDGEEVKLVYQIAATTADLANQNFTIYKLKRMDFEKDSIIQFRINKKDLILNSINLTKKIDEKLSSISRNNLLETFLINHTWKLSKIIHNSLALDSCQNLYSIFY